MFSLKIDHPTMGHSFIESESILLQLEGPRIGLVVPGTTNVSKILDFSTDPDGIQIALEAFDLLSQTNLPSRNFILFEKDGQTVVGVLTDGSRTKEENVSAELQSIGRALERIHHTVIGFVEMAQRDKRVKPIPEDPKARKKLMTKILASADNWLEHIRSRGWGKLSVNGIYIEEELKQRK